MSFYGEDYPEPPEWADDVPPDAGNEEKDSASTILVKLAMARYEFGVSESGETFAVPRTGPKVVRMLRGGKVSLRGQLSRDYFRTKHKAAPQQALADALLVIEGEAQEADEQPLCVRVARHGDALWLDLGDQTGRAVRVDATGWTVTDDVPVLFKRTALTSPLPEPTRGGTLDELWRWLNATPADRPLIAAWLVAALFPDIPHPILGLFGEQGTAKTTALKVLTLALDPSPAPARKPPKDAEAWVTAAAGSWVVGLDNLSGISEWLSDTLCRAVTGDGDVRRKLYADRDIEVFSFRRALAITGIDIGASRGDLADRMMPVDLDVIGEDQRLEEAAMWAGWAKAHPLILGAVLDLAASVLAAFPSVRLASKPRMADFARILAAVDHVLGTAGLDRYMTKQRTLASDSLTGDSFIVAVAEKLEQTGGTFTGTAAELLDLVTPTEDKWRAPKGWPATARAVTQRLRRQAPPMRKSGWTVTDDGAQNKGNVARWIITAPTRGGRNLASPASPASPNGDFGEAARQARQESGHLYNDQPPPGTFDADPDPDSPYQPDDDGVMRADGACCGKRTTGRLVLACHLCPNSPTYWRRPGTEEGTQP